MAKVWLIKCQCRALVLALSNIGKFVFEEAAAPIEKQTAEFLRKGSCYLFGRIALLPPDRALPALMVGAVRSPPKHTNQAVATLLC